MLAHYLAITIALVASVSATPLETLLEEYLDLTGPSKFDADDNGDDYDIHYDQRQSGTENYRLNIDGVIIAAPSASESGFSSLGLLATQYLSDSSTGDKDDADDGEHHTVNKDGVSSDTNADKPYPFEVHGTTEKPAPHLDALAIWDFKNGGVAPPEDDVKSPATGADRNKQIVRQLLRSKSGGSLKKRKSYPRLMNLIQYMRRLGRTKSAQ